MLQTPQTSQGRLFNEDSGIFYQGAAMMFKHVMITSLVWVGCCFVLLAPDKVMAQQASDTHEAVELSAQVNSIQLSSLISLSPQGGIQHQSSSINTTLQYVAPPDLGLSTSARNFRITRLETDTGHVVASHDISIRGGHHNPPRDVSGIATYQQSFSVPLQSAEVKKWAVIRGEVDLLVQTGTPLEAVLPPLAEILGREVRVVRGENDSLRLRVVSAGTQGPTQSQVQIQMSEDDWQWVDNISALNRHDTPLQLNARGRSSSNQIVTRHYSINQASTDDLRLRLHMHGGLESIKATFEIRDIPLPLGVRVVHDQEELTDIVVTAKPSVLLAEEDKDGDSPSLTVTVE